MTAYYNEIDEYAAQWLRNLIAGGLIAPGVVDTRSIVDVQPNDLIGYTQVHFFAGIGGWSLAARLAGWPDDKPLWTGSCPCQPFSAAGKRKGTADARHLWPEMRRLIAACRPDVVAGEQVASADGRLWLAGVCADLEDMAYEIWAADLCSAGTGAPHIRQRVWWLGDARSPGAGRHAGAVSGAQTEGNRERLVDGAGGVGPVAAGSVLRLAESDGRERDGLTDGQGCVADGSAARWQQSDSQLERGGSACGLADDSEGRRLLEECDSRPIAGREVQQRLDADGCGGTDRLVGVDQPGPQGRQLGRDGADERALGPAGVASGMEYAASDGRIERRAEPGGRGAVGGCGENFWSTYDVVHCTDGKARRFEPGSFPLAHGVSNRVGRLRAYGNAINPHLAAEVLGAYLDGQVLRLKPNGVFA